MKFGEKLKELRLSKQLTQRQIADELGVAPSIYNRFEKNERKVKREFLSKLAVLLDIHEEDLTKYWIADQVYKLLENESNPQYVISMVAEDLTEYGIKNL
ncbi:MAG: helix-turn-helix transcriptional regulator [Erysipelotrichales bacterium]|nr:helix-turn-helix transcriptional regulator [Erysipelotrichales bacterium]